MQLLTGDSLDISQPSVCKSITAVSSALTRRVDDFIKWPEGNEANRCKIKFYDVAKHRKRLIEIHRRPLKNIITESTQKRGQSLNEHLED